LGSGKAFVNEGRPRVVGQFPSIQFTWSEPLGDWYASSRTCVSEDEANTPAE